MSTEVAQYQEMTPDQLMALTGQATGKRSGGTFPRLTINKEGLDDQERQLPVGFYAVSQGGITVFGKPITFRPFINCYQYAVYDADSNTFLNHSILIKSFNEEAIDELGGVSCGKISKKKQEGLTKEQLDIQKKIKCYRIVYGTATFEGVTASNEKQSIVNLPVEWRLSGDNFMDIQEVFDSLAAKKILMLSCNMTLTTTRKKQGTNVWYHADTVPDTDKLVTLTKDDWELLKAFQADIDSKNKFIIDKHKAAHKGKTESNDAMKVVNELYKDLDDDISDIGTK